MRAAKRASSAAANLETGAAARTKRLAFAYGPSCPAGASAADAPDSVLLSSEPVVLPPAWKRAGQCEQSAWRQPPTVRVKAATRQLWARWLSPLRVAAVGCRAGAFQSRRACAASCECVTTYAILAATACATACRRSLWARKSGFRFASAERARPPAGVGVESSGVSLRLSSDAITIETALAPPPPCRPTGARRPNPN
jgi:hypothetical protein